MTDTLRKFPLFAVLLAFVAAAAFGVELYDEQVGTVDVKNKLTGVWWDPTTDAPTYEWKVELTKATGTKYLDFGYYVIANGKSPEFTLAEGENRVKTNQFLGFWASYKTFNGNVKYDYSTIGGFDNHYSIDNAYDVVVVDNVVSFWPKTNHIVFFPIEGGGDEGGKTTGQPLPGVLASSLLCVGIAGAMSRRKKKN